MTPQTSTHRVKLTYEDYVLFPEDGRRHELIGGDHYVTPSPNAKHQKISRRLLFAIELLLRSKPVGEVYDAPFDVVLSETDTVQPDLLFVSAGRRTIVTEKNVQGAPDLVIEIISETTRKTDEIIKRHLYERYGVQEYWIVDPELEAVKVYRMSGQGYVRTADLTREAGDSAVSSLLPGLAISLSDLFAD